MQRYTHFIDEPAGRRAVSYLCDGDKANPNVVLCVHGLTRQGRDFEPLAAALAGEYRVICPDVAGRGESDRLADPTRYQTPTYVGDLLSLLDSLGAGSVTWIGTSMGGLIGMVVAGSADPAVRGRIGRLVLNDVGPHLPGAAITRIGEYVRATNHFATMTAAEEHIREVYAPYGALTDAQWRFVTECSVTSAPDGGLIRGFDPAIATAFVGAPAVDIEMWPLWTAIECPVLALRGAESDLLLPDVATRMRQTGPKATVIEFVGCGHAPPLLAADQIEAVTGWLRSTPA